MKFLPFLFPQSFFPVGYFWYSTGISENLDPQEISYEIEFSEYTCDINQDNYTVVIELC